MKTLFLLIASLAVGLLTFAQEELHIRQINIGNGDAAMIGIYDVASDRYTRTLLIDGGNAAPGELLLPSLKDITGSSNPHFDYVALTHYHKDHYNGLLAMKDGRITADSVIDPGNYPIGAIFPAQAGLSSTETPSAAMTVAAPWTAALKSAVAAGFIKGHVTGFFHYGTGTTTQLGNRLVLGTAGRLPVIVECVAGWGNTLNGSSVSPNPAPERVNPNNFTLAFIISCGQFRYFTGGDLGGEPDSPYVDQETPLIRYFAGKYPESWSWNHTVSGAGHICGFKAGHHGSNHSNTQAFMNAMTPAFTLTSAGDQASWHLPHPAYLQRLEKVRPLSVWTASGQHIYNRGVYMTNLFDFNGFPSRSTSTRLFAGQPGISFSYGNDRPGKASGYLIRVKTEGLADKSQFRVYRMTDNGGSAVFLANFLCHGK